MSKFSDEKEMEIRALVRACEGAARANVEAINKNEEVEVTGSLPWPGSSAFVEVNRRLFIRELTIIRKNNRYYVTSAKRKKVI